MFEIFQAEERERQNDWFKDDDDNDIGDGEVDQTACHLPTYYPI